MNINSIKIFSTIIFLCLTLQFLSCKKNSPAPVNINKTPSNFSEVFDEFWNGMNTNYVYWDIDTTNWDAIYRKYKPVFNKLNLNDQGDVLKSVSYFREMTKGLVDGHYAINFFPAAIQDSFISPSSDNKLKQSNFHSPFLYISIDSNYLDKGFVSGEYATLDNMQVFTVCGTIKNEILYFYCSGFALKEASSVSSNNGVKSTLNYFFSKLQDLPEGIKGVIIDVRNNKGGNVEDLDFLVGKLTGNPLLFGYVHYKSGSGRLSYTPWINASIKPQPGINSLKTPIIVLADNYSVSLSETVAMSIRALPNTMLVGETTWGATGPITDNVVFNDGKFVVPGFLSVYTSSAAFKYVNGKSYEGKGFPPDIYVPFNFNALITGSDPQLDTAISLLK